MRRDRVKIPFFGHLCATWGLNFAWGKAKLRERKVKPEAPKMDRLFTFSSQNFKALESCHSLDFDKSVFDLLLDNA